MKQRRRVKILTFLLIAIMLLVTFFAFAGCEEDVHVERKVTIEVINPNTGEVLKNGDRITLPWQKTYIDVKITDNETGKVITDEDLPDTTVRDSYDVNIQVLDNNGESIAYVDTQPYWPLEKDLIWKYSFYDEYEISIFFDCMPKYVSYDKFDRKYRSTAMSVRFYIDYTE